MLGSCHCLLDRPLIGGRRSAVSPVCTGGFGSDKKKAVAPKDSLSEKKIKRAKSKGKSSMRMSKPGMGGIALTEEQEQERKKELDKRMSTAGALRAGALSPDEEFSQRLSSLKKEGKEKAAMMKMKNSRRPGDYSDSDSILDEKPFGAPSSSESSGSDDNIGPNQGAIVALSVFLLIAFLWSTFL